MATIRGGLNNVVGSFGDVLGAPFRLLRGDVGGSVKGILRAPLRLVGGVLQTGAGVVTAPFKMVGSIFGRGRSSQALEGSQAAMRGRMQRNPGPA